MSANPWTSGVLPRKTVKLIALRINAASTNLDADGTRRHTRAALEAGAAPAEILFVLKCASVMAIHALAAAAPVLMEEAKAAGEKPAPRPKAVATPACDEAFGRKSGELSRPESVP